MTIDERLEAVTMNLELASRDISDLAERSKQADARLDRLEANLNRLVGVVEVLARVAETHGRRIADLEGSPS